jgi:ABC-type transport system involved in multi-copper enzyme maturation permease subunit
MTCQPIIERELRRRAREPTLYWMRSIGALAGLLIGVQQSMATAFAGTPTALGQRVFNGVVAAAFVLSCSASLLAADTISAERRQGTLGLLLLTSVRGFDVLFAKFVSVGLATFCALIAFLPALMIPVLAGGIDGAEALRKTLALLTTLLFAIGVGLFGSASRRARVQATGIVVGLMLAFVIIPFFLYGYGARTNSRYFGAFSPLVLTIAAGEPFYRLQPRFFWYCFVTMQGLAWALLVGAGLRIRRAVVEDASGAVMRSDEIAAQARREVGVAHWRPEKNEGRPIEWVVFREHGISAGVWWVAVLGLVASRWMSLILPPAVSPGTAGLWVFAWPLGVGGAMAGGAMVAMVAGRFFGRIRLNGELDLLLTTPLGAERLVTDQWLALRRAFVIPVLLLQIATLLPVLSFVSGSGLGPLIVVGGLPSFINTYLGTTALCWVGLVFGLKAPNRPAAILWTLVWVEAIPWLIRLLLAMIPILPELVILGYYAWLIPFFKKHLLADLPGVEPPPLQFSRKHAAQSASSLQEHRAVTRTSSAARPGL